MVSARGYHLWARLLLFVTVFTLTFIAGRIAHQHYFPSCADFPGTHPQVRPWSEGIFLQWCVDDGEQP